MFPSAFYREPQFAAFQFNRKLVKLFFWFMNATRIATICTRGRDQDARNRTGRDEASGRDEEAGHSLRTAHLSRWATGTGGPCLPVFRREHSNWTCPTKTSNSTKEIRIFLNSRSVVQVIKMNHDIFFHSNQVLTSRNVEIRRNFLKLFCKFRMPVQKLQVSALEFANKEQDTF